jgi:hypothetical protein
MKRDRCRELKGSSAKALSKPVPPSLSTYSWLKQRTKRMVRAVNARVSSIVDLAGGRLKV